MRTRSSAWPLALLFAALVVYASLYPFTGWRVQGVSPLAFLWAPLPQYWTGFDLISNLLGYAPLGFLLTVAMSRSGWGSGSWLIALACSVLLSMCVETAQNYLPMRVPSNIDLALNASGAWLGALSAWTLERLGVLRRWSQFRADWFEPSAYGSLVLLALWPLALLFPAALPLGLGQVMERMEAGLVEVLADTPFLYWLPVREVELQPLLPVSEILCVALGALIPCLIAYCVVRPALRRIVFAGGIVAIGVAMSSLSATLTWGPQHAWDWLEVPVRSGLLFGLVLAVLLAAAPHRVAAALALLAMGVYLGLLNQSPADPYFKQTLQTWEQGRFIRFHGLAQWLGWLWPYAAVAYLVQHLWLGAREN